MVSDLKQLGIWKRRCYQQQPAAGTQRASNLFQYYTAAPTAWVSQSILYLENVSAQSTTHAHLGNITRSGDICLHVRPLS